MMVAAHDVSKHRYAPAGARAGQVPARLAATGGPYRVEQAVAAVDLDGVLGRAAGGRWRSPARRFQPDQFLDTTRTPPTRSLVVQYRLGPPPPYRAPCRPPHG